MPKKNKSSKLTQSARKEADALVVQGNAHLERAMASRQLQQRLQELSQAEAAYQRASTAMEGGVHLDSAYNLGICATRRAAIAARQQQRPACEAAQSLARKQFEAVIAMDTSGRSETLAMAHASLASLIVQSLPQPDGCDGTTAAAALAALDEASAHLSTALNIRTAAGDHVSVTALRLQAGDAQAFAMRWCLASVPAAETVAAKAAESAAAARCEAACVHYDEGLRSPVAVSLADGGVGDVQLLEQKVKVLHGLLCWGAEQAGAGSGAPLPPPFVAALGVAQSCVKALVALLIPGGDESQAADGAVARAPAAGAPLASVKRARAEVLVACGDVVELCASASRDAAAATAMRADALRLYRCAVEAAPIADAYAGAAELLLDEGRAALVRAGAATSGGGSAAAAAADADRAADLLRRSAADFRMSAQLEPQRSGVHIYNFASAAALLGDDTLCKQALVELRAQRTAGGNVAAEASALLADMAHDSDFNRMRHAPWFISRET